MASRPTSPTIWCASAESRRASLQPLPRSFQLSSHLAQAAVSVRTPQGEGASTGQIALRTSISGFIENTTRQPLSGITVRLVGTSTTARTGAEGAFILPDVQGGAALIELDGTT